MRAFKRIRNGKVSMFGYDLSWRLDPTRQPHEWKPSSASHPYRLHIGPGAHWTKPNNHWVTADIDPARGDIVVDFQKFVGFPLPNESCTAVYASHTFEHISPFRINSVVAECFRILQPGGILRVIVPNPEASIREYIAGNADFELFRRRRDRAKQRDGVDLTLFECLREDFISKNWQPNFLGESLAHQNAWDFEAMKALMHRNGFSPENIRRADFEDIGSDDFNFEGTYPSEANERFRSLYIEAIR